MKRLFSGAVLTMVAASSMLVACSSNTATPSTTPRTTPGAASSAQRQRHRKSKVDYG
ncbi:hypothetical protein [Paenibacillus sp. N3.4]|uniref:hypothetical protein n=1 Tax=Paenibacillus sp. N3.4 TaxID=2603222 RepID=UPI00164F7136|nr:hypothetical protein [Paenibacillus sp. N3.4]